MREKNVTIHKKYLKFGNPLKSKVFGLAFSNWDFPNMIENIEERKECRFSKLKATNRWNPWFIRVLGTFQNFLSYGREIYYFFHAKNLIKERTQKNENWKNEGTCKFIKSIWGG